MVMPKRKDPNSWDYVIKRITSNGGLYGDNDLVKTIMIGDDDVGYDIEKAMADDATWDDTPMPREEKKFEEFAKAAMHELAEHGLADFVLLKNDKLRAWWQSVLKEELAAQTKREAIERKKMLKEQALSKLSDEEKEALGLNRKK